MQPLLLELPSVNGKVKEQTQETQEGFFLRKCSHGFACLLLVPLFSKIPIFSLFLPLKSLKRKIANESDHQKS